MGNILSWNSFSSSSSGGHSTSIVPRTMTPEPMTPDQLRQALIPTWDTLYQKKPEAIRFHKHVELIKIFPDYLNIIEQPMDLKTIRDKLETGKYSGPPEFCDDVWLMIDNFRNYYENHEGPRGDDLHHQEISRHYGYSKTLSKIFANEMIPVLRDLGCSHERTEREYRSHE